MLPELPYQNGAERIPQTQFGGLDRRKGAGDGAIADMTNLWSEDAPVLSARPRRYTTGTVTKANGIFSDGVHLFVADGTTLYVDGVSAGSVTDTRKVFAALGERVVIWPDKKLWTSTGGLVSLESTVSSVSCTFDDGTYAGEAAEANTIKAVDSSFNWSSYFSPGDAVSITGAADAGNNKTSIVREIDGNKLIFYENTWTKNTTAASITVARTVPDLDFLCVNDNRVWGCKGDTVACCKLGDPKNWNVFDGLSTDAWSWDSGTAGSFTGCVSFLGYPTFFKEEAIFKVYGSKPSNYEAMRSAATGVLAGADRTLAIAKDNLYYLSRVGFVAYAGGMPAPMGQPLGDRKYTGGAAGSDGRKYYVSAQYSGETELLVYDPEKQMWHREDTLSAAGMAWKRGLYAQTADSIVLLGTPQSVPTGATEEATQTSSVTFARWAYTSFQGKYPVRLWLRFTCTGTLTAQISYDGGAWENVATSVSGGKYLPVPIRRCDSWQLKLTATGDFSLYALEQEYYDSTIGRGKRLPSRK